MGLEHSDIWFEAAYMNNVKTLDKVKLFKHVEEDILSKRRGFSAIHYASYFGNREAITYLERHEKDQLTKYPVRIELRKKDNAQIVLTEGLSYQCILALQGHTELLNESLYKHSIVSSTVPLLSCIILGNCNIDCRYISDIANVEFPLKAIFGNPLVVAMVTGNIQCARLLLSKCNNLTQMIKESKFIINNYTKSPLFLAIKEIKAEIFDIEEIKDLIKSSKQEEKHNEKVALTIYSFLKKQNRQLTPTNSFIISTLDEMVNLD